MAEWRDAEMAGEGLADVCICRAASEAPWAYLRIEGEDWHALARVLGAAPGWVVTMVGSDDQ